MHRSDLADDEGKSAILSPGSTPVAAVERKILSNEQLAWIVADSKRQGRTVVQAHGTFDLLHFGHLRHLQAARRRGDVLIVSITADRYVNKGPGRPVFKNDQRAEMLAALGCVDYVTVVEAPDADAIIRKLKPDYYVKGREYENAAADVTGKIAVERAAVESVGGELIFTDEVVFSSSSLINRHLGVHAGPMAETLDRLRAFGGLDRILALLEQAQKLRVLLIGDAIIDEYQYVAPMGKSPKENMIATRFESREIFAGGVFAAANHVASFCREVDVVTSIGGVDSHEAFVRETLLPNVHLSSVVRPKAPTTRKCRFVDPAYIRKLFEVYFFDDAPLQPGEETELTSLLEDKLPAADLTIVTDFGHGLISRRSIDLITRNSKFLAVNAQSNSANIGFNLITRYPRADYVCIDAPEARLAVSDRDSPMTSIIAGALPQHVSCPRMIVTHGRHGCVTHQIDEGTHAIPAFTDQVVDTVGAGDAFFVVTAPLIAVGCPMHIAGVIGNLVGALKVKIVGHRKFIDRGSVVKALTSLLK